MFDQSTEKILGEFKELFQLLKEPIFHINKAEISIISIIVSIIIFSGAIFLSKYLGKLINKSLANKNVDSGVRDSIEKFSRYFLIGMGFLFSLENFGVSISSLAAVGAVLMVGIGFGLQNITQNFISGIILLIERPIKVGDIIRVGSSSGKVMDIRVRSSIIQTRDDVSIIIPNSKFLSEEVISETFSGQKIRQHIKVGVAYGSDVKLVIKLLCEAALTQEDVLKTPMPNALLVNFGDSSLDFDLRFWCVNLWQIESISSQIRIVIEESFRNNGVEIPFPQRDIHVINKQL
jgi:small-conductance mechanosensitive channel